jgi:integrase
LGDREIRRITRIDCAEWARHFRKKGSSTTYNNTLARLRHVFDVAIETGIIYRNPSAKLERVPVRAKQLTLPTREQFLQLVEAIEHAGGWCSSDCADFLRRLAFTEFRTSEAAQIECRDPDFDAGEIVVRGRMVIAIDQPPNQTPGQDQP